MAELNRRLATEFAGTFLESQIVLTSPLTLQYKVFNFAMQSLVLPKTLPRVMSFRGIKRSDDEEPAVLCSDLDRNRFLPQVCRTLDKEAS